MPLYPSDFQPARKGIRTDHRPRHARLLRAFVRDEEGTLVIFALYILVLTLMVGGIGIDLMQVERNRASLQYTLDRAVLAAADLDQKLDPQLVVADYMDKAQMSQYLGSVVVSEGLGYRVVSATASGDMRTQFMHMSGIDTLTAPAASTAEERIDGVEISLVLDVSGSMNSNSRLTNLKVAAKEFVDTMVDNSQDGKLSISIIPYATQVSTPAAFLSEFNVSSEHSYSNCVNFTSADFDRTDIPVTLPLQRTMHFDMWDDFDGRKYNPKRLVTFPVCEADSTREILPLQKDRTTLKNFIDNLTARGNTSIDVGMKWGTALIDPSLRPVITKMIANGSVPNDFSARPHLYDDGETLKVIVLMTDGANTSQYYIKDDYRTGASNIWWNDEEQVYSVYDPNSGNYYWPGDDDWHEHAYGNGGAITYCARYRSNGTCRKWETVPPEPGEAFALDYPELWARTSVRWNTEEHYYPWMDDAAARSEWRYGVYSSVGDNTKDARTRAICEAAKDEQVIVYTISFEANWNGKQVLRDCASSASHYFDVNGLEISDAFSAIASSIRKLRLTQ